MEKILVATDLSARSDRALHRALALAKQRNAALEVIHVIEDDIPQDMLEHTEELARNALEAQLKASPLADSVDVKRRFVRGQDYVEIIKESRDTQANLVVLGISRHTSSKLFRGTTAERVVRLGQTPSLVVKTPTTDPYKRIVVGFDLSVHSRKALEFAATFAPNAEIFCVHAAHEPFVGFLGDDSRAELVAQQERDFHLTMDHDLTAISQRLGTSRARFHAVLKIDDPVDSILLTIDEMKADLVVTGTHGRAAIAHAVLGSVAEEILAQSPVDVLVARAW